jgi:SAM-dependent methyltransferase
MRHGSILCLVLAFIGCVDDGGEERAQGERSATGRAAPPPTTVLNTMAFTGYPDGRKALSELVRVLRPGGRLVIIDVNYPSDGNRLGTILVESWKRSGDLIRDMHALFAEFDIDATDQEIGGFGSVHLYLATKHG